MEPVTNATVYIVDDDADVRDALAWLLRSRRLYSESFASAEAFLQMLDQRPVPRHPQCLLLDVRMTGMTGLSLFELLKQREGVIETIPVIFLTGHADVPTAVQTVKQGAFDFCEKPFSDNVLVDRIRASPAAIDPVPGRDGAAPCLAQPAGRFDRARARRDEAGGGGGAQQVDR